MPTPTPSVRYKVIAIQQQPKAIKKNIVQFDVYRVVETTRNGNYFQLSNELKTGDFDRAIKCKQLQPLGIVVCDFGINSQFITLPQTGRTATSKSLCIKSQLYRFDPNKKNHNNQYTASQPLSFRCPIPHAVITQNLTLDYEKDMLSYAVLSNVEKYIIEKNQAVGEFRTYFISEMPNDWDEIHYQLNPNEYAYISLKPA